MNTREERDSIEKVHAALVEGSRVITDSRAVQEGDIFIALEGERHDGNRFAGEALARGARLAVVNERAAGGERRVATRDTTRFLQQLAGHHRRYLGIPVLAITGTNGKTTTKELCHAALSRAFVATATRGNLNNHIGVPLTLLEMNASTRVGIVEMGANHPGEIAASCAVAAPDLGIITNVGDAHLEGFGSRENVARAKGELYDFIRARGGTVFVTARDEQLARMARGITTVTYSGTATALYPYLACDAVTSRGQLSTGTRLVGEYNADNVAAAVAVALYFGVTPVAAREAIEGYSPSNLRSQLFQGARNTVVLDAYNANPGSMRAAIAHFAGMPGENKLLVLGEMLELGEHAAREHEALLEWVATVCPCRVLLVGRSFEAAGDGRAFARWFPDTAALVDYLRRAPVSSSLVLVKGSRGNALEQIVECL
ncbi:MAG: UDP-N-acetylmuramoyl-tripeptide--D-alanyl-D-alanine ligase [Odoribacteraceae bacterium]|nr:UDP-N-acetylmuramoyl-tripeptide--D-alanyl-D-alanine ligase [Odoribacteraceae bacterium]